MKCSVSFCVQSLERCQLKEVVSSKPGKLDSLGEWKAVNNVIDFS